jgi:hypothetical protein
VVSRRAVSSGPLSRGRIRFVWLAPWQRQSRHLPPLRRTCCGNCRIGSASCDAQSHHLIRKVSKIATQIETTKTTTKTNKNPSTSARRQPDVCSTPVATTVSIRSCCLFRHLGVVDRARNKPNQCAQLGQCHALSATLWPQDGHLIIRGEFTSLLRSGGQVRDGNGSGGRCSDRSCPWRETLTDKPP